MRRIWTGLLSLVIPLAAQRRLAPSPDSPPGATSASFRAGASSFGLGPGDFAISPDSQYVVLRTSAYQLFSQRLRDGTRIQIGPPACSRTSSTIAFSPDSQTVLFLCSVSGGNPLDLWAVPIEGPASAAIRLSISTDPPTYLPEFQVAPDGKRVLYTVPRTEPYRIELYSVPIEGPASASVLISSPMEEGLQVRDVFALSASSGVTFRGELGGPGPVHIWLTDLNTPVAAPIGVSLPSHPIGASFLISPDEQHIVWVALSEAEIPWLFSASISVPASSPILLNATSPESLGAALMLISPDSARVAFVSNPGSAGILELLSVPIDGSSAAAVNLSAPTPSWNPNIWYKQPISPANRLAPIPGMRQQRTGKGLRPRREWV